MGRPSENPKLVIAWKVDRDRARRYIVLHVRAAGGNLSRAAQSMQIGRRSLHRWIAEDKQLRDMLQGQKKELQP